MSMIRTSAAAALAVFALSACATKGFVRNEVSTERSARVAGDSSITNTMNTEFTNVKGEISTLKTDVAALRTDLTALRTEFGAKITAMENGMKFAFPVTFAYDDATVRDEDRASLDRFVQVVNKYYGGSMITVEGFADPAGSTSYNRALSQRRAESVSGYIAHVLAEDEKRQSLRTLLRDLIEQHGKPAAKDVQWAERALAPRRG